nr:6167_t:CDS:2 [Entrophospora candida]CAG8521156.1 7704_t:CDS:2 [Entrophospora candida]
MEFTFRYYSVNNNNNSITASTTICCAATPHIGQIKLWISEKNLNTPQESFSSGDDGGDLLLDKLFARKFMVSSAIIDMKAMMLKLALVGYG